MGEARVSGRMGASAEAVWELISAFGDTSWMPGGAQVEVEGAGPGMARVLQGPGGKIREQLESLDREARRLVYTIPEGAPFPVTGYRATMEVRGDPENAELCWSCEFEPEGVSEEQARAQIEQIYGVMLGWIRDRLAATAKS